MEGGVLPLLPLKKALFSDRCEKFGGEDLFSEAKREKRGGVQRGGDGVSRSLSMATKTLFKKGGRNY